MGKLLKQYRELKTKRTFSFQRGNYTEKVKKRHDRIITDFLKFCEGHAQSIYDLTWKNYAAYIRMLHSKRQLKDSTIERTYKHVLKQFFEDLNLPIRVKIR